MDTEKAPSNLKEKRGTFLLVLCILSWISSGFWTINYLSTLASGKKGVQDQILEIEDQLDSVDSELMYSILESGLFQANITLESFYASQLSLFIIYAIGILSVFLMFKLKRNGFGLYALYGILAPIIYFYFFKSLPESTSTLVFSLSISAVFIIMYYTNLKRMTN
ncbi:MAG: hypothetical protein ACWA41_07085 [Putridiphycobacter sp.]